MQVAAYNKPLKPTVTPVTLFAALIQSEDKINSKQSNKYADRN